MVRRLCKCNMTWRRCGKPIANVREFRRCVNSPPTLANRSHRGRAQPSGIHVMRRLGVFLGQEGRPSNGGQCESPRPDDGVPESSPPRMPGNSDCGFTPLPCVGFPNMVVDPCPEFDPNTLQPRKREIKLMVDGKPGASVTQLLAKLIHVLPLEVQAESLLHMEQTERNPSGMSIAEVMDMIDARLGRTDSVRDCSWLTAFAEFKREAHDNNKDLWARFTRCVDKLNPLGKPMNDKVVSSRAIRALRLPGCQLPIAISALKTRSGRFSAPALREITIRMYETHKPGADSTGVFAGNWAHSPDSQNAYHSAGYSRSEGDRD